MATTPYTASPAVMQPKTLGVSPYATQEEEDAAWEAQYGAGANSGATAPFFPDPAQPQSLIFEPPSINDPPAPPAPPTFAPPYPADPPPPPPLPPSTPNPRPTGPVFPNIPPAPPPPPPPPAPPPPPVGGVNPIPQWNPIGNSGPVGTTAPGLELPYGYQNGWTVDASGKPIPVAGFTYSNPVYYGNNPASAANAAQQAYGTADLAAQQQQQIALNNYGLSGGYFNAAQDQYGAQLGSMQNQQNALGGLQAMYQMLDANAAAGQGNAGLASDIYGYNAIQQLQQANQSRQGVLNQVANLGAVGYGTGQYTGEQAALAQGLGTWYGGQAGQGYAGLTQDRSALLAQLQSLGAVGQSTNAYSQALAGQANQVGAAYGASGLGALSQMPADRAAQIAQLQNLGLVGQGAMGYTQGQAGQANQLANFYGQAGAGALANMPADRAAQLAQIQNAGAAGQYAINYAQQQAALANQQSNPFAQAGVRALSQGDEDRTATQQALAQMRSFLEQPEGPSAAEALLRKQADQTMAQNVALARSGRGAGDNVLAQRQALFANAAAQQQLGNDMAALRATEAATRRGQQLAGYGAVQQGQAGLRGQDLGAAEAAARSQLGLAGLAKEYTGLGLESVNTLAGLQQQGVGELAQRDLQAAQQGATAQLGQAGLAREYAGLGFGTVGELAGLQQQAIGGLQQGSLTQAQQAAQSQLGQNQLAQLYAQMGIGATGQFAGMQGDILGRRSAQDLAMAPAGQAGQLAPNPLAQGYTGQGIGAVGQLAGYQSNLIGGLQGQDLMAMQALGGLQGQQGSLAQQYAALRAGTGTNVGQLTLQGLQNIGGENSQLLANLWNQQNQYVGNAIQGLGAAQAQRTEGQQLANNILNQQLNSQLQQQSLNAQLEQQVKLGNLQALSGQQINQAQISAQQALQSQQVAAANQSAMIGAAGTIIGGIGGALIGGPGGALVGASAGSQISDIRAKKDIAPQSFDDYLANGPGGGGGQVGQPHPVFDFRPAKGYSYDYKNPAAPGAAPGRQFGPMAQDLEKTAAGAFAVGNGPTGQKFIDPARLTMANTAGLSEQQRKLESHDQALMKMASLLKWGRAT